jgi:phosphoribosyl 1,2-cyclic phosphodiesterase
MKFSVLSSGSKANCTYVETASLRFLIDCGLSALQTERRLAAIGVDPSKLNAILITHEHSDHVHGVHTLSKRYHLPVYANEGTAACMKAAHGFEIFSTGTAFEIRGVKVSPFRLTHDAVDPVGFTIFTEGLKFSHVTDLGKVTPLVRDAVTNCNALVLESNHDPRMLQECQYPWELKQRIASSHGHLSNDEAGKLLAEVLHPELFHVVLGHLSENSNTPMVARRTVSSCVAGHRANCLKTLVCACVAQPTPFFEVGTDRFVELAASA